MKKIMIIGILCVLLILVGCTTNNCRDEPTDIEDRKLYCATQGKEYVVASFDCEGFDCKEIHHVSYERIESLNTYTYKIR